MPALAKVLPFQHNKPREKLLTKGAAALSDTELLAAMLGSGTKQVPIMQLAQKLAAFFQQREDVEASDLLAIPGVGRAKAVQLAASLEFARRRLFKSRPVMRGFDDLVRELSPYANRRQEHFLCISLNGARELLALRVVCIGSTNRVYVEPRDVFAEPMVDHAASIVLAHNHPCGSTQASAADLALTRKMRIAGHLMGIDVIDHIVFSGKHAFAMSQQPYWNDMVSF